MAGGVIDEWILEPGLSGQLSAVSKSFHGSRKLSTASGRQPHKPNLPHFLPIAETCPLIA
jgi:hypothetical protein